jgi:hypothetical protein
MANSLNIDLAGKVVVFKEGVLKESQYPRLDNLFLVGGGFGAQAHTNGRMLAGTFLSDGEQTAFSGYDVERLATDDEVARMPLAHLAKEA